MREKKERLEKGQLFKRKNAFRGSLTVEVSLLFPFLIFLLWSIFYLALFVYDQSAALQGSYCTALRTERYDGTKEEKEELAEKKYELSVRKKIAGGRITPEIQITEDVSVTTLLDMKAPAAGLFKNAWHGQQRQQAEKWQPVAFIRKCRLAEDISEILKKS